MRPASVVDHLVVAAATLEQGEQWCEATFGITPAAGGSHPLMGTHNRLVRLAGPQHSRCYLEIIAIDPGAAAPATARWFDLDQPGLQAAVQRQPRLVHFVARCTDAEGAVVALRERGLDPGSLVRARRKTPAGTLQWDITIRADGQRLCHGTVPALIPVVRRSSRRRHARVGTATAGPDSAPSARSGRPGGARGRRLPEKL